MNKVVTDSNTIKIILLGFPAVQKTIISTLMTLSRRRDIQYEIIDSADIFESDILLLDVHDEVVLENWGQLKDIVGDTPVLAIGDTEIAGATNWLKRAVLAASLLDTLDEIAVKTGLVSGAAPAEAPSQEQQSVPAKDPADPAVRSNAGTHGVGAGTQAPATASTVPAAPRVEETSMPTANVSRSAIPPKAAALNSAPSGSALAQSHAASVDAASVDAASPAVRRPENQAPLTEATLSAPAAPAQSAPEAIPSSAQKMDQGRDAEEGSGDVDKPWPVQLVEDADRKHDSRMLVVDDSLSVWTQMKICLEQISADVDYVSTAEDALRMVNRRSYNLIFMDVMLPGRDGYDACKSIKTNPDLKGTPVVMLTSKSAPANKVRGVLSGCNYYLTKPLNEQELKAIVQRFMLVKDIANS